MNAADQLTTYIAACRRRLRVLGRLDRVGIGFVGMVAATVLAAVTIASTVPAIEWVFVVRAIFYAALVVGAVFVYRVAVSQKEAARHVDTRIDAFDGRLASWIDADDTSRLRPLLEREVAKLVDRHPPSVAVPARDYQRVYATFGTALVFAAAFLILAPQPWHIAAERIWFGDSFSTTRPTVEVDPGNVTIPRGSDITLRAALSGFSAEAVTLHVRFQDEDWQSTPMGRGIAGYEFSLLGVNDPAEYYVSAKGLASARFELAVVDLPRIDDVTLTIAPPEWTRLQPEEQPYGDVEALPGSTVTVDVAGVALDDATLYVNGVAVTGTAADLAFDVSEAGRWYIATPHDGEPVRISDEYFITLLEDHEPAIEFVFPGRDRAITSIDEAVLEFRAIDDYGVEDVEISYAINGSTWQTTKLDPAPDGELDITAATTFYLEDLTAPVAATDLDVASMRPLRPGDVISFHAVVRDHAQETTGDLYFLTVRPFEKNYREVQGGGGGGGGGGEGSQMELSERQRDILVATWNLIRNPEAGDAQNDRIEVIRVLQQTLREQVETLIARSEGRGLDRDDEIRVFVDGLTNATVAMEDAAALLQQAASDEVDLNLAVVPEQTALNHLLTAEASLRDVDVSFDTNNNSGGGGGGGVDAELSELVDLEMDVEKNRYEVPQEASFGEQGESGEDEWSRLEELARREQQRADQPTSQPSTPVSEWQLEQLERELNDMRARAAEQGNAQATRALERALESMQGEATSESRNDVAEALRDAASALREAGQDRVGEQIGDLADRARQLADTQRGIVKELEQLQDRLLEAARNDEPFEADSRSMDDAADTKREMQAELNEIEGDLTDLRESLAAIDPVAEDIAERSLEDLADNRVSERLAASADAFEYGEALFTIGRESLVEDALDRLASRLSRLSSRLEGQQGGDGTGGVASLEAVQNLRQSLANAGGTGELRDVMQGIADFAETRAEELRNDDGGPWRSSQYRELGTNAHNDEALRAALNASLDQFEIELRLKGRDSIRAESSRGDAYDEERVARYFEVLGACTTDDC